MFITFLSHFTAKLARKLVRRRSVIQNYVLRSGMAFISVIFEFSRYLISVLKSVEGEQQVKSTWWARETY